MSSRRSSIPPDSLLQLRQRLDRLPPKSPECATQIAATAQLYGISVTMVYRSLHLVLRPRTAHRSDHGQPRILPPSELEHYCELIAALKLRTTNKIGELATQIRSLGYGLVLAGQDLQRLIVAAGKKVGTLIANMGTRIAGNTVDPEDTLQMFSKSGGREFRAEMGTMQRREGVINEHWGEGDQLQLREHDRIELNELQALRQGEIITLFKGEPIRGAGLFIEDRDKITQGVLHINRFIEVPAPSPARLWSMMSPAIQQQWPSPERIQHLRRLLAGHRGISFRRYAPGNLTLMDDGLCVLADLEDRMDIILDTPANQRGELLFDTALTSLMATRGHYRTETRCPPKNRLSKDLLRQLLPDSIG